MEAKRCRTQRQAYRVYSCFPLSTVLFLGLPVTAKANVVPDKGAAYQDKLQNLLFSTLATQSNDIQD